MKMRNSLVMLTFFLVAGAGGSVATAAAPAPDRAAPGAAVPAAGTPAAGTPAAGTPAAGTPAAASSAVSEAGEPRADVSNPPAEPASEAAPSTTPPRSKAAAAGPRAAGSPGRAPSTGNDRIDLNTATVTGDREQPKVMYIVPWKHSDIGDLSGKPMNSLLDEALAPVDRDEFKREVAYYGAVKASAAAAGPPPGSGTPAVKQVEK